MLETFTLDQLRALIAVIEEGSFSAAARKLHRVQSAISTSMANLETQLGVPLWDRTTKVARLTDQGQAVLAAARKVCTEVDALRKLTAGMVLGLEASVSFCVDMLFPLTALVDLCERFRAEFPSVDLRVDTQTMTGVSARVIEGSATIGVASPMGVAPGLERRVLTAIQMVPVVAPHHPLAAVRGPVSTARLRDSIQLVLSELHDEGHPDQAVLSARTWRVRDLHTKHALLRAGLGWGNLPEHLVREDLRARRLIKIRVEAWGEDEHTLYLSAVYRSDVTFGPAHRWLLTQLEHLCLRDADKDRDSGNDKDKERGKGTARRRRRPARASR
ncbi:MAG TPA: LysR family transcriptional regulator [Kofleriaceae bacterium]|nr:LysR family transcriptional regulator [Kofleriaceae bacterium]